VTALCRLLAWLGAAPRAVASLSAAILLTAAPAAAEQHALVVAGLGGEPPYEAEFRRQAEAAAAALGSLASRVTVLTGDDAAREKLRQALQALGAGSRPARTVVLMLIGHGSYDERDYRFNLPGPDVTGAELASWLDALPVQRQLVVAATSASGALLPLLERPGRTVISATRSGGERNVSVFPGLFAAALADEGADTDKDGHVSVAEAFAHAEAAVTAHYREQRLMATEHPRMAGPESALLLARLPGRPPPRQVSAAAGDRLATLEAELLALRAEKDALPAETYYAELQRLMLEVAVLRRQGGAGERGP
jgi:hypothetical protein